MSRKGFPVVAWLLGLSVVAVAAVGLTRRNLTEPHVRLFSEMVDSPAYKPQSENPVFRNGRTLQAPPPGTIALDGARPRYAPTAEGRALAARELKNPVPSSYQATLRGKAVYGYFCRHCHGPRGKGGGATAKAYTGFSFSLAGKSTYDMPDGELFHILSYGRNRMPALASQIRVEDRWTLVHYIRSLQLEEKDRLGPLWQMPEDPRRHHLVSKAYGKELYLENCASCHGADGKTPKPGTPTLHSPVVLAVAGDAYYWDIINHGRKGSSMPAWDKVLTRTQIRSLILHIRSWLPESVDRAEVLAKKGDPSIGSALYRGRCAPCHGKRGEGGIGNSLRSPSFLALASDQFLRDTITFGRRHTAMPSAHDLNEDDVRDLIAHIRAWNPRKNSWEGVKPLLAAADAGIGRKIFRGQCSGCHGPDGKGGIGSRLNSDAFLRMVDDEFLYRSIVEGRPGTAMPSWGHLEAADAADLIKFIRGWQTSPARAVSGASAKGRPEFGELLFKKNCEKCHGPQGRGDIGSQIGNPKFLEHVSDEFLLRTIAFGKKGTEMKGHMKKKRDPLSQEDIGHIITYLRFLQNRPRIDLDKRTYSWASAEEGKSVYESVGGCAKCHGARGEGASGPALGGPDFLRAASNGFIAGSVVLGREGTEMRSFFRGGNVRLSQEQVENVTQYIRGFEKTPMSARRRVERTASAAAEGGVLYGRFCAGCHGSDGSGSRGNKGFDGYAPSLSSREFLRAADDDFLLATIALGRPGTPMRAFGSGAGGVADLSASEMKKIVAFIRTWETGGKK